MRDVAAAPAPAEAYDYYVGDSAGTWVWVGVDGSSYYEDSAGNWGFQDASGFKAWGSAVGDYCDSTGFCKGSWTSAPTTTQQAKAQATKQAASAKKQATPQTAANTQAPTAQAAPTTQLAGMCSPPANLLAPGDSVVSSTSDGAGGATCVFASGASYYIAANGNWTYIDPMNNSYSGDASGNYCDSFGNCTGSWLTKSSIISGIPDIAVYGGIAVLLIMLARRR